MHFLKHLIFFDILNQTISITFWLWLDGMSEWIHFTRLRLLDMLQNNVLPTLGQYLIKVECCSQQKSPPLSLPVMSSKELPPHLGLCFYSTARLPDVWQGREVWQLEWWPRQSTSEQIGIGTIPHWVRSCWVKPRIESVLGPPVPGGDPRCH